MTDGRLREPVMREQGERVSLAGFLVSTGALAVAVLPTSAPLATPPLQGL